MEEQKIEEKAPIVQENSVKELSPIEKTGELPIETPDPEKENWKKYREKREQERKEKLAAEERAAQKEKEVEALKAAMEALVNKPQPQEASSPYYESDEERVQKMVAAALEKERQRLSQEEKSREIRELPQRLEKDFRDFNNVCSSENLDYLEYHYPEVARAFGEMRDGYNKWASVYGAVKKLVPNLNPRNDLKKADENLNRPQSMSTAGRTATGDTAPQYLDDRRKAENWKRMQQAIKGGVR